MYYRHILNYATVKYFRIICIIRRSFTRISEISGIVTLTRVHFRQMKEKRSKVKDIQCNIITLR